MVMSRWTRAAILTVLIVGGLCMLFPFAWLVSTSLKPLSDAFDGHLIPHHLTLANFAAILSNGASAAVIPWLRNSVIAAVSAAVLVMVLDSLAAYSLARLHFYGKRVVFYLLVGSLMVPFIAILIPLYLEFANFNLLDTYGALILPYTANAFGVFLLYQFFINIPKELEEAAIMDGANKFQRWRNIFFPLSIPATATLGLLTFMNVYNDFFWPLVATSTNSMRTMTVGVALMTIGPYSTNYPLLMSLTIFSMLPTFIVFLIAQRQLLKGVATTGLTL
jgi:multiple sugar transport system permease protein